MNHESPLRVRRIEQASLDHRSDLATHQVDERALGLGEVLGQLTAS